MNPDYNSLPSQQSSDGSDINQMVVLQPGERVVCQIKRHPIGLYGMYFSALFVALIAVVGAIAASSLVPDLSQQAKMIIVVVAALIFGMTLLYTYIGSQIYNANRWIVTSDSITQVTQVGLFNKQTSQLSMNDLEDVTVQQTGLLQSMFSFGTLRAETAGERSKFLFMFCPNPNYYARQILIAREDFMNGKRYSQVPRPRTQNNENSDQLQGAERPYQPEQDYQGYQGGQPEERPQDNSYPPEHTP